MPTVVIRPVPGEPEAAAAALLAAIVYYDRPKARTPFQNALRVWALRERMGKAGWAPETTDLIKTMEPQTIDDGLDLLVTRRLPAAGMCGKVWAVKAFKGTAIDLQIRGAHGGLITGVTQAALHVATQTAIFRGNHPPDPMVPQPNTLHRVWVETLPVLHLACGLRSFIIGRFPDSKPMPTLEILRTLPTADIIRQAALFAPLISAEINNANLITVAMEPQFHANPDC